jgi:hypothetical protein
MNPTLPALLVAAAFGLAIAKMRSEVRARAILVFAAAAALMAFAPRPPVWNGHVHLACWAAIVACGASLHLPNPFGARPAFVLALAAGTTGGAVASEHAILLLPPTTAATWLVAQRVARRVPIAPKVVSSWLIAVALLAATLEMLPVTPGYLPDHLE